MRVRFGTYLFDAGQRDITRAGTSLRLSPKAFDLLAILIEHAPNAVRKQRLYELLWPDTFVEYANLNNLVLEIRKVLGDHDKSIVVTRARFGFAFGAQVEPEAATHATEPGRLFRITHGNRNYDLQQGRNLIGRENDCAIVIDSPSVSRYHATIEVHDATAHLEDLGSKNGTFLGGRRITSPVELHDKDEIEIGRRLFRFRIFDRTSSTVSDPRPE